MSTKSTTRCLLFACNTVVTNTLMQPEPHDETHRSVWAVFFINGYKNLSCGCMFRIQRSGLRKVMWSGNKESWDWEKSWSGTWNAQTNLILIENNFDPDWEKMRREVLIRTEEKKVLIFWNRIRNPTNKRFLILGLKCNWFSYKNFLILGLRSSDFSAKKIWSPA